MATSVLLHMIGAVLSFHQATWLVQMQKEKRDQKQINRCISAVCSFPPFIVLFDTILIEFQRK